MDVRCLRDPKERHEASALIYPPRMTDEVIAAEPRLSATQLVRQSLERDISDGTLMPGDALDEDALSARFEVSRTPVREALIHLSVRGLVSIIPRVGIHVARLSIP